MYLLKIHIRWSFCLLFLSVTMAVHGQDSTHLSLIYKMGEKQRTISPADTLIRSTCIGQALLYASLKIYISASARAIRKDSLFYDRVNTYQWGDSVLLSFNLPRGLVAGKRLSFQPIYHFVCLKSSDSSRDLNQLFDMTEKSANARFINLSISSNPAGAKVYLIPKLLWIRTPDLLTPGKREQLSEFAVYQKKTPVTTQVLEYVYVVVYEFQNRFGSVEIHPNYIVRPNDAVNFDFN